jgi:hypothetical protein
MRGGELWGTCLQDGKRSVYSSLSHHDVRHISCMGRWIYCPETPNPNGSGLCCNSEGFGWHPQFLGECVSFRNQEYIRTTVIYVAWRSADPVRVDMAQDLTRSLFLFHKDLGTTSCSVISTAGHGRDLHTLNIPASSFHSKEARNERYWMVFPWL